jgi:hypothetical protein
MARGQRLDVVTLLQLLVLVGRVLLLVGSGLHVLVLVGGHMLLLVGRGLLEIEG